MTFALTYFADFEQIFAGWVIWMITDTMSATVSIQNNKTIVILFE